MKKCEVCNENKPNEEVDNVYTDDTYTTKQDICWECLDKQIRNEINNELRSR